MSTGSPALRRRWIVLFERARALTRGPRPRANLLTVGVAIALLSGLLTAVLNLGGVATAGTTVGPPAGCTPGMNPVQCENSQPGTPKTDSPMSIPYTSTGDPTIQGFATQMNVDVGQTVSFKVDAPTVSAWHINIFRMGYYQGLGSREWASDIVPSVSLPQSQPVCEVNPGGGQATGLIDCGNWAVSASWQVPSYAVSGLYMALLIRDDTGGVSEVPFVVSDPASTANVVYQTSDATWEAYNAYNPPGVSNPNGTGIDAGNSLYQCYISCPPGAPGGYVTTPATEVSYNRPLQDGGIDQGRDGPFYSEFPMIQFLEENGYDVTYISETETDSNAAALTGHKIFVSSGHDEYWSANMRNNVEAALKSGVNLAFFSGNEDFWKTQYAPSPIDQTSDRTVVSYKETHNEPPYGTSPNQYDPSDPPTWTGSWRDPQGAGSGGDSPENSLTGQYFIVNSSGQNNNIAVPYQYANLPVWKNTAVAKLTSTSPPVQLGTNLGTITDDSPGFGTLGYEWDVDADNGFRPAGEIDMSSTTVTTTGSFVNDYGTVPTSNNTTETHHLTLYRAASGALVFGSGTVQFSWGLNNNNPIQDGTGASDPNMQQFVVNLFAMMGTQPNTLISGLVPGAASTSTTPPTSAITSPTNNASIADGAPTTVTGTATDTSGGVVAGVEVSVDGGQTWHPATINGSDSASVTWTYSWQDAHGTPSTVIESRATDASGNTETPSDGVTVNVICGAGCSIFGSGYVPATADNGTTNPVTVGVKFTSDTFGTINGIKFYKSTANTGTHVGQLWTSSGQPLATAIFTNETTSGWQTVLFSTPVPIAPHTTYVASYYAPKGHTAEDDGALEPNPLPDALPSNADGAPLHALRNTPANPNGVDVAGEGFPTDGDVNPGGDNYGVDVLFTPQAGAGPVSSVTAGAGYGSATLTWNAPATGGPVTTYTITPYVGSTAQPTTTITGSPAPNSATVTGLTNGTTYTFTVTASNPAGTAAPSPPSNAVTPSTNAPPVFVQQVSADSASVSTSGISVHPTSNLTAGNRLVVEVGTWSAGGGNTASVTDSAGDTFTALTNFKASDGTQMSIWTAPITNSGGTMPTVTAKPAATSDMAMVVLEYQGLSSASGTTVLDQLATNSGTTSGATTVQSGATPPTSGTNELALGFYADSGFDDTLGAGSGYSARANISPTGDMEALVEDEVLTGSQTPSASVSTGANTTWLMATVVLKTEAMTPPTVPGQPTNVTALPGNGSAQLGWNAPADGGAPISSYTITPYVGSTAQTPVTVSNAPPVSSANVSDLTPGVAYTFTVAATNSVGTGPPSAASNSVTPANLTQPAAPTNVTATAGNTTAAVTWTAPNDGGSPITSYTVIPATSGNEGTTELTPIQVTGNPPATSVTATGLSNGTTYIFSVEATNAVNTGNSTQSNPVTPATTPSAPTGVNATAGSGAATVTWTAPATNGGSTLTGYVVTPYVGAVAQTSLSVTAAATAASATVPGLTNGTTYTFTVSATNALGTGPASAPSNPVTPTVAAVPPGTPFGVTATAGTNSVTVSWAAPSNGGSTITSYTVTPYAGSTAGTPATVSGNP
ncbi:MAG: fibronectin type III domain-containing protein, partial [Acidimicrobiales bacterium]|nr:fibronectin type III domain-containing protein [Acidimicrobiales bacterium]